MIDKISPLFFSPLGRGRVELRPSQNALGQGRVKCTWTKFCGIKHIQYRLQELFFTGDTGKGVTVTNQCEFAPLVMTSLWWHGPPRPTWMEQCEVARIEVIILIILKVITCNCWYLILQWQYKSMMCEDSWIFFHWNHVRKDVFLLTWIVNCTSQWWIESSVILNALIISDPVCTYCVRIFVKC